MPVAATVAVLMVGAKPLRGGPGVVLNAPPLQLLGRLSYAWYLWHWPFLVFAAEWVPVSTPGTRTLAALAALGAAGATHVLVENPIRFHPSLVRSTRRSFAMAAALMVVSVGASAALVRLGAQRANTPAMAAITAAATDLGRLPREECLPRPSSGEVRVCSFGDTASPVRVVLFGDSHAMHWFNPFERIAAEHHWRLTLVTRSGCRGIDLPIRRDEGQSAGCREWRSAVIGAIDQLHPTVVLMANATTRLARGGEGSATMVYDATRRTLRELSSRGIPVVVLRDTPFYPFAIPICLARRGGTHPEHCQLQRAAALPELIYEAERRAARGLGRVQFVDLSAQLCPEGRCPVVSGGTIMYRDDGHITGAFADMLKPALDSALMTVMRVGG
ncbi:MAG: SGNH hydrolase domain-containing protein [Chloroflexia bacterium]